MSIKSLSPFLQHTLFINLESRTDRLSHVTNELKKLEVVGTRFNAVKMANGAVGCTISHIKCLELAKTSNFPYVFICEDDICFGNPELLLSHLKKIETELNVDWDVLIIGGNMVPPFKMHGDFCAQIFNCQTTTGYIVKQHYYDTLIQNFKDGLNLLLRNPHNKRDYAIDMYWKSLQLKHKWFIVMPLTVYQLEGYSDIEQHNTNYKHLMLDKDKEWLFKKRNLFYN